MSETSFFSEVLPIDFRVSIITGVCRSGKTTLGNLLATSKNVEHSDEPWTLLMLPILSGIGAMNATLAKEMFIASASELFNEMVHLRRANFRPNDLSSIYHQKEIAEIFDRLTRINSRQDVRDYVKECDPLCLLNLAETSAYLSFFPNALPNCKVILLIRKGEDVAKDCFAKSWFSNNQLQKPLNRDLYKKFISKNIDWYLPWWVSDGEEEFFTFLNEYERCIYYWCRLMEKTLLELDEVASVMKIHYEQLHENPRLTYNDISSFLKLQPTALTEIAFQKIEKYVPVNTAQNYAIVSTQNIHPTLKHRLSELYHKLEY